MRKYKPNFVELCGILNMKEGLSTYFIFNDAIEHNRRCGRNQKLLSETV
jgi:hypothetical protein